MSDDRDALREAQRANGAGAWEADQPLDFGDPAAEYRAAQEACALVDLTDRAQIEITGDDRVTFLNNFCTADIKQAAVGSGGEAFATNIKGRILAHLLFFVGESAIWIDCDGPVATGLLEHLDKYLITEDVTLADRSADWGEMALLGPQAASVAAELAPPADGLALNQHVSTEWGAVRRCDMTRAPGWLLCAPYTELASLWNRAVAAGAQPCGRSAFEALRIEACFPRTGVDLTGENLAHEAGRTSRAISFTKGCYLGQEPIARLESMGHTNQELRGLRIASGDVPERDAVVLGGEEQKPVGRITSSALSSESGEGVALAVLRREVCTAGTEVMIERDGGEPLRATVFEPSVG